MKSLDYMRSSATCGRRSVNFEPPRPSSSRLGRVVNGVDAPVGAIPWQVCMTSAFSSQLASLIGIEFDQRLPSSSRMAAHFVNGVEGLSSLNA
jgi:hypothetical protein